VQLFSFKTRTAAHGGFSPMNRLRGISAANILFAAENRLSRNMFVMAALLGADN